MGTCPSLAVSHSKVEGSKGDYQGQVTQSLLCQESDQDSTDSVWIFVGFFEDVKGEKFRDEHLVKI